MTTIARYTWDEQILEDGQIRVLSHKNDIKWDKSTGSIAMCNGLESYAQTIEAVVKTVKGELITQRNYGIPYFTTIFCSKYYADEWANAVKESVSALDFVSSIDTFEYTYDDTRKIMRYKLAVTATDGSSVEVIDAV